jgi:hypothetical protein
LTQNFVPLAQLPAVLEFLEKQVQSVSGFNCEIVKDPYKLFVSRMEKLYPGELDAAKEKIEIKSNKKGKWDQLVGDKEGNKGFSFGFGGSDSDDE